MSTTVTGTTVTPSGPVLARPRTDIAPIRLPRLVAVELRKMFDTRAGFWLMASIGLSAVLASAAVVAWAPDSAITFDTFGTALGFPMTVVLPVIAILSVTSEWSQRSGLTTFTLAPRRGRVLLAKGLGVAVVGVTGTLLAFGIGAVGNLAGAAIAGVDPVWDMSVGTFLRILLAMNLSVAVGFMLGLLFRSSAAAIVGYFVYTFVLPTLFGLLAAFQGWFRDLQPWVDFNLAASRLYDAVPTTEQWAQLGVTGLLWLALPLLVGTVVTLRSEVK